MLLVLALAVFVVLVPALCAVVWVLWLRDLAERTGCSEWLSGKFSSPGVFMFCVVAFGVSEWTLVVTLDPLEAFVFAPVVCTFAVGGVGWVCGWTFDGAIFPASLPRCATSFGDLRPAPAATPRDPMRRLPSNAQDRRPLIRLVIGNVVRERRVGRRRRQPEETDENGHRLQVLTPEQREAYRRFLRGEGGDPRD
jgi:hypothetical protein